MTEKQQALLLKLTKEPMYASRLAYGIIRKVNSYKLVNGLPLTEATIASSMLSHMSKQGYCFKRRDKRWQITEFGWNHLQLNLLAS
jgi:hypothetical protein